MSMIAVAVDTSRQRVHGMDTLPASMTVSSGASWTVPTAKWPTSRLMSALSNRLLENSAAKMSFFEDLPASGHRADEVYLDEVGRCAIYLGLFGDEYGSEDAAGLSPTEREFDQATAQGKVRLIFVKGADDANRHPKMRALIGKAGAQLIRRRFASIPDLTAALYASMVERLERTGKLRTRPFDAAACPGAELTDISPDKV